MSRQPGKGSRKSKQAAMERKATQHQDFIGETAAQEKMNTVVQMAAELEDLSQRDAATLRVPRSIEEGKQLIRDAPEVLREKAEEGKRLLRDAPDALREKARERLSSLPDPAQRALQIAQEVAGLLFAPLRIGLRFASGLLHVPLALIRVLRHKEA